MIGKRYLGDGVYVELENDMLKLTTELNTIYLDATVFNNLVEYRASLTPYTETTSDRTNHQENNS